MLRPLALDLLLNISVPGLFVVPGRSALGRSVTAPQVTAEMLSILIVLATAVTRVVPAESVGSAMRTRCAGRSVVLCRRNG